MMELGFGAELGREAAFLGSGNLFEQSLLKASASGGWITAFCDGGSRGNPGPAGFGVLIQDSEGQALARLSEFLGTRTNNFAEYSGLLAALDYAIRERHPRLRVVSDSELMVKQIKGQYRVNSPELRPLYEEAKRRIAQLDQFRIEHVLRGKNQEADGLANQAMDRGMGRPAAAEPPSSRSSTSSPSRPKMLRGLVKGGVVQLIGGELPDGTLVKVLAD